MPVATVQQQAILAIAAKGTNFLLDPGAPVKNEVSRLAETKQWKSDSKPYQDLWIACFGSMPPTSDNSKRRRRQRNKKSRRRMDDTDNATTVSSSSSSSDTSSSSGSLVFVGRNQVNPRDIKHTIKSTAKGSNSTNDFSLLLDKQIASREKLEKSHDHDLSTLDQRTQQLNLNEGIIQHTRPHPLISPPLAAPTSHTARTTFYLRAFESHYPSTSHPRLPVWQKLCHDVGIESVPESIKQCKKALSGVHVNIVNLLEHLNDPRGVELVRFGSGRELAGWTKKGKKGKKGRVFPKEAAKGNGFLRVLLERLS